MSHSIVKFFGALFILVFVSGCSVLPAKQKGQSVMVFFVENDYRFRDKYLTDYRLYYTDTDYILIDPEESYDIRKNLPAGIYEFTKLRTQEKSNAKLGKPEEIYIRVELKQNEFTLVPEKFVIHMETSLGKDTVQDKSIVVMSEQEQKEVLQYFSSDKNAAIWGL